jgi:hypothetical protein
MVSSPWLVTVFEVDLRSAATCRAKSVNRELARINAKKISVYWRELAAH